MSNLGEGYTHALLGLVGKRCWGIAAGANTGSVIDLHFGAKVPRRCSVPNPTLPADLRDFGGEFGLLVECAWRLDAPEGIVCGWIESASGRDPMNAGLRRIMGQTVQQVSVVPPAWDLSLHFENTLILRVFCDRTASASGDDNYTFFTPTCAHVVSNRSCLVRETPAERSGNGDNGALA